ncbi:MAG: hypothetical protein RBS78_00970 [Coriobacteriia bacterium]|jgi:hypothetical protein|nr:hypothetical protein [Coriobacteriia bacterium]
MSGIIQANAGEFLPAAIATESLPPAERRTRLRDYINWVEEQLLEAPQAEADLEHHLVDGLYTRTMRCPAGTTLTGAVHKRASLTFLIEGEISVLTEKGCARLTAPLVFPSAAGIRRLGHCHTDVVWATVCATAGTTLAEVEAELFEFVAPDEE